jgi:uncharacterized flavoprotein (TIGR03862 family)
LSSSSPNSNRIAIIGGGPAGLMAAEAAADRGAETHLFDAMPSVGRKFLMAGKSGLNLTHAEPTEAFLGRFGTDRDRLGSFIERFGAADIRAWASGLGVETFVGSSGRVFPADFKAAPLLRAWVRRLRDAGVTFHVRHRWTGWDAADRPIFATPDGAVAFPAGALILAPGGASWPGLGSDGAWAALLRARGLAVTPFAPANCGFDVGWSDHFRDRFAGQPVKPVGLTSDAGHTRGEFVITSAGVEGSAIYRHAAALRDRMAATGTATLTLDLLPDRPLDGLIAALDRPRGARSLADHLRRSAGIAGVKAGLLRECAETADLAAPIRLAGLIKALPLVLTRPRPIEEAISTAGGLAWAEVTGDLMIRSLPGVFAAGEMLDWEVTTGGYLLTACMALGRAAGAAAAEWLSRPRPQTAGL